MKRISQIVAVSLRETKPWRVPRVAADSPPTLAAPAAHGDRGRPGLTLLEVMLALAILGMSIASLSILVHIGVTAAEGARDETTAQLIAESRMNEITCGAFPLMPIGPIDYEYNPDFLYAVSVGVTPEPGLLEVRVLVQRDLPPASHPATFELVRWLLDPAIEAQAAALEAEMEAAAAEEAAAEAAGGTP